LNELDQEHDSEDEGIEDYKLGGKIINIKQILGYHPVHVGENLMNRYVVI
jgi:serine/threonine-protein kinase SRPK3